MPVRSRSPALRTDRLICQGRLSKQTRWSRSVDTVGRLPPQARTGPTGRAQAKLCGGAEKEPPEEEPRVPHQDVPTEGSGIRWTPAGDSQQRKSADDDLHGAVD